MGASGTLNLVEGLGLRIPLTFCSRFQQPGPKNSSNLFGLDLRYKAQDNLKFSRWLSKFVYGESSRSCPILPRSPASLAWAHRPPTAAPSGDAGFLWTPSRPQKRLSEAWMLPCLWESPKLQEVQKGLWIGLLEGYQKG